MSTGRLGRPMENEERYAYVGQELDDNREKFKVPYPSGPVTLEEFYLSAKWYSSCREEFRVIALARNGIDTRFVLNAMMIKPKVLILDQLHHDIYQSILEFSLFKAAGRNNFVPRQLSPQVLLSFLLAGQLFSGYGDVNEISADVFRRRAFTELYEWEFKRPNARTVDRLSRQQCIRLLRNLSSNIDLDAAVERLSAVYGDWVVKFVSREWIIPNSLLFTKHYDKYYYVLLPIDLWTFDADFLWLEQRLVLNREDYGRDRILDTK